MEVRRACLGWVNGKDKTHHFQLLCLLCRNWAQWPPKVRWRSVFEVRSNEQKGPFGELALSQCL